MMRIKITIIFITILAILSSCTAAKNLRFTNDSYQFENQPLSGYEPGAYYSPLMIGMPVYNNNIYTYNINDETV